MRSTPFNTRSSEWIGDMTVYLRETGEDNSLQMEAICFGLFCFSCLKKDCTSGIELI